MLFDKVILDSVSEQESRSITRLIERGLNLPAQPQVLQDLVQHLALGIADLRVLSRHIAKDPGIVAMLFKLVESPAYRSHHPFRSIEQILQVVGIRQTANFVRAISFTFAVPAKHNRKGFEAYWSRSRAISQLAMLIAGERVAVCNIFPDQACLAGTFHDCGVAVLMQRFSTYGTSMHLGDFGCWTNIHDEDLRFDADHCVVGYLIARHWKLPDFICNAIRYHHDITRMGDHEARTMVAILQLAIHIYHRVQCLQDPEWEGISAVVLEEVGLSEDGLPEFVDIILEQYHKAA